MSEREAEPVRAGDGREGEKAEKRRRVEGERGREEDSAVSMLISKREGVG